MWQEARLRSSRVPTPGCAQARGSRLTRFLELLAAAAAITLLGVFIVVMAGSRVLPYRVLAVQTGSMTPSIPKGSLVFLRPVSWEQVQPGDVISFHPPGRADELITHRVAEVVNDDAGRAFITQGDANPAPDPWQVQASGSGWGVAYHARYVGYALLVLRSPLFRLALIWGAGAAIVLMILVPLWTTARRVPSSDPSWYWARMKGQQGH